MKLEGMAYVTDSVSSHCASRLPGGTVSRLGVKLEDSELLVSGTFSTRIEIRP